MPIGNAIEKSHFVYVYDEKGKQLFAKPSGNAAGDGLKGYTSTTVSIQRASFIYTYNEKGSQVSAKPAR
jgi:hypothetical protein